MVIGVWTCLVKKPKRSGAGENVVQGSQHLCRMALDARSPDDTSDVALGIEDEAGADQPHEFPAVELLHLPQAKGLDDDAFRIGRQGHLEPVLAAKLLVALDRVGRHADKECPSAGEFVGQLGEFLVLIDAAAGIILRIEEQDHRIPNQLCLHDLRTIIAMKDKIRGRIADLQVGHVCSCCSRLNRGCQRHIPADIIRQCTALGG